MVDRYVRQLIINPRGKWNFGQGINERVEDKQLILLERSRPNDLKDAEMH